MLDIEFIVDPFIPDKPIIYLYYSGFLRSEMRIALARAAAKMDLNCGPLDSSDDRCYFVPDKGEMLFDDMAYVYCDWSDTKNRLAERQTKLERLTNGNTATVAHFANLNPKSVTPSLWNKVKDHCFIIEEPVVSPDTLVPVLRYLDATCKFLDNPKLAEDEGFRTRFQETLGGEAVDLGEAYQTYTLQILNSIDPLTGQIDMDLHRKEWAPKARAISPFEKLKPFLETATTRAMNTFLMTTNIHMTRRKWDPETLYCRLCEMVANLIKADIRNREGSRECWKHRQTHSFYLDIALWTALVIAWRDKILFCVDDGINVFRGPNTLLATLQALCEEFRQKRLLIEQSGDPLQEFWGRVNLPYEQISRSRSLAAATLRMTNAIGDWEIPVARREWLNLVKSVSALYLIQAQSAEHADEMLEEQ